MEKTVRDRILEMVDKDYQKFSSSLNPNVDNILGVRLPNLRRLAKEIAKGDWQNYINTAQNEYFEETMLQGMVIGTIKADIEEVLRYVTDFVPKIDNWSVCDSFCSSLKIVKNHRVRVWEFLQSYFSSKKEYELRFAIVMLLNYYIDDRYLHDVLARLDQVKHEGYYVKMAVAWALSICFIKYPQETFVYLKHNNLDNFTYNKALQKITESLRIDKETKKTIRSMKRK
ncbi:DNA alkylation repair protein [Calidifontibacillus oryziterrae]|uniref:DNA alkylation repair protein n=1 Tax=Calidifontibacillus oryziterrae TaxID=1191699 RepID=UPI0002DD077C|nr:DNA alkylation repair protein [Calidifontibacillus oryziterrae]